MYRIEVRDTARKQILQIPPPHFQRIKDCIDGLAQNPRPAGVLRLKGETGYRAWVGDYRILYEIDDTVQMMISIEITIVEAGMGERIRIRPFPPILLAHLTTKRQQL